MNEIFESKMSDLKYNNEINWRCKICKDIPCYAGMYLCYREGEKNDANSQGMEHADFIQMKYYYALLLLLDEIHNNPECPNTKQPGHQFKDCECHTPECSDYYQKMLNTYRAILTSENKFERINIKCDICSVLPYAIFGDLDMVAKNIHSDDMEKTQKLELDAIVADLYLDIVGSCENWGSCPNGTDWLELMNSVWTLNKYLETGDHRALQISLNEWNRMRAIDNLLDIGLKPAHQIFRTQNIPSRMLEEKTLVYLDFGVYQIYESNNIFRTQLDSYTRMDGLLFVYSPAHMEEVCRMGDSKLESKRRETIAKICAKHEVIPVQEGCLKILEESVNDCFARANNLQYLNRCAEVNECAIFEALEERTCRLLGWDEKKMDKCRQAISNLESTQLFDPQNKEIDNKILNQVFYEICGARIPLEEFKDYLKNEKTFQEIREAVRLIYMLMNALGYHRNKVAKRSKLTQEALYPEYTRDFYRNIRSGFYDVDHICYASKCDYFVTCDNTLSFQAEAIYSYLGCKTQVIYYNKKADDPSLPLEVLCKGDEQKAINVIQN